MMKRLAFLALTLVFLGSFVFAASITVQYPEDTRYSLSLTDSEVLNITIEGIPAHAHAVYVTIGPELEGHVYCAPGMDTHDANESWDAEFTCIALPGTYEGDLIFRLSNIDRDENGDYLVSEDLLNDRTRITLSVTQKEVWYTNYGYTNIGGSIVVGPYRLTLNDAETISADVEISRGSSVVYAGLMFIGQEVNLGDMVVTFNGYSEKRGLAFFTFKTTFPASVSSSTEEYYLVTSHVYYVDETNKARVDIYTNCPTISLCDQNGECTEHDIGDTRKFSVTLGVGEYTVKCAGVDKELSFSVLEPPVIVKTVTKEVKQDPNQICPSWFYSLPETSKAAYCGSVSTSTSRPSYGNKTNPYAFWIGLLIVVGLIAYWYYKKGGFSFKKDEFKETEKEVEAVPEMEG